MKAKGRRPVDYFHPFYADTSVNGSASAIRCGLASSDPIARFSAPIVPSIRRRPLFIRETLRMSKS